MTRRPNDKALTVVVRLVYVHHMSNLPPLMTTAEVAEECGGVSVKTVTRWVESGQLSAAHKLPGLRGPFLFDAATVARFKAERDAEKVAS